MAKSLKFRADSVTAIRRGEQTVTLRLFDEKALAPGDDLELIDARYGTAFATATVDAVTERTLGSLTANMLTPYEQFTSLDSMYTTFSDYYSREVDPETPVKVVQFTLTGIEPRESPRPQPIKRAIYISGYVLLGLLVAALLHAAIELPLLGLISSDPARYTETWWWRRWDELHVTITSVLFFAGTVGGYRVGVRNWRAQQ